MGNRVGRRQRDFIHLTLVPYIAASGELKTKPTQHSVKELRAIGIQPDILLCRSDRLLPRDLKAKIALFCNVSEDAVVTAQDVKTVYEVPLVFNREGLDHLIADLLACRRPHRPRRWQSLVDKIYGARDTVTIGVVGKYVELEDSYKSLNRRVAHGRLR